jgi:hypothetical protein
MVAGRRVTTRNDPTQWRLTSVGLQPDVRSEIITGGVPPSPIGQVIANERKSWRASLGAAPDPGSMHARTATRRVEPVTPPIHAPLMEEALVLSVKQLRDSALLRPYTTSIAA